MVQKRKKENFKSEEELLEQALIANTEYPYIIPQNWAWCTMGSLCEFERGITFPAVAKENESSANNIPCLRTANVQEELDLDDLIFVDKSYMKGNDAKFSRVDDIIMSSANSRELVGKTCYVSYLPYPMTFGGFVLTIRSKINSRYMFYYLRKEFLAGKFMGESTQTTNIANINTATLSSYSFPLAPLAEQKRIVDRIESVFAKLDEAKEKAQAVVDGFEDRKAAILHRAFTGELTEKWRKDNRISKDSWKEESLENVCTSIFDGDHMPPPKAAAGVPFLVISNVNTGHLSFENTRFVPEEYYDSLTNTRKPNYGDVLYTLVGSYGIPVVVDDNRPFCFQRHMALLKPCNINSYYLWYQLQTQQFFDKATSIATGTAQLTVPIKGLRKLKILLVSDEEQAEIVRLLNVLLEKEERTKEIAEQTISTINIARKSILARALRGELGTNDPNDESAIELLRRILK